MSILVTQDLIDRYGRVNGDSERLHYDPRYAQEHGFRGSIAHGTMLVAPLFDLAVRRFGPEFLCTGSLSMKWTAPVCDGDLQLVSIDDDGQIEAVIGNLPERPASIRGRSSLKEQRHDR